MACLNHRKTIPPTLDQQKLGPRTQPEAAAAKEHPKTAAKLKGTLRRTEGAECQLHDIKKMVAHPKK